MSARGKKPLPEVMKPIQARSSSCLAGYDMLDDGAKKAVILNGPIPHTTEKQGE